MIKILFSNTTKSQIDHLKTDVLKNDGLFSSNIVICEDRFTLSLEQEILASAKSNGSFSLNVFSFSRLLQALMKNGEQKNYLSKTGGIMMISKILQDLSSELKCYRQVAKNYSTLSQSIFDVLSQLKSSMVTYSELQNAHPKSSALSMKTSDLGLIYKKYEQFKSDVLLDSADKIELLHSLVNTSNLIANSNVYVIGFTSFTKQLLGVLGAICNHAKNVDLYVLEGDNPIYESSTSKKIQGLLTDLGLNYSTTRIDETLALEKNAIYKYLFSFTPQSKINHVETDNIILYQAPNLVGELKFVAEKIIYEVRINNRRFSDIAIIGGNLSQTRDIISRELNKYEIPHFLDDKIKLSDHIFTRFIVAMLDIAQNGFEMQSVLTILHSPFVEIPLEDKCDFENYLVAKGISKRNFKNDLLFKDEKMKKIRDFFIEKFKPTFKQLSSISDYVANTLALVELFEPKIQEISDTFAFVGENEHAQITLQAVDKFKQTLDEMQDILGDTVVTLQDYSRILLDGLSACEISIVPLFSDSVFIGDFSSSKFSQKQVIFAIGVNNKVVPLLKSDIGLITDRDIDGLAPCNIDLEPKIEMINDRERLNVFLSLLNFSDTLYLTFSSYSMSFDIISPSEVITTFSNIFTHNGHALAPIAPKVYNLENKTDLKLLAENEILTDKLALNALALSVSQIKTGDEKFEILASSIFSALKSSDKNTLAQAIVTDKVQASVPLAFNERSLFSVSNLESYFSCPFKNFVKNALYARERDEGFIKAVDSGNYIHEALELFMSEISQMNKDNFIPRATNCVAKIRSGSKFATLDLIPRFSSAMDRLDREFILVASELMRRQALSDFTPIGQEIKFGINGKFPPLEIGDGIKLQGAIDYADKFKNYVRVIDYKTGKIDSRFTDIFLGQKFQPYIYLSVLSESMGATPSGALYFPIQPQFNDDDDMPYRMKGYITNDIDALVAMDKSLESEKTKSDIIPLSLTQKNVPNMRESSCLTDEEFKSFIAYSKAISLKAVKEIQGGNICPSPYDKACDHCQYLAVCGYDIKFDGARKYRGKISKDTIIEGEKNG